jgi:protein-tyrosine phosphatase
VELGAGWFHTDVAHVLFLCEGNVCRSPFAQRVLQRSFVSSGILDVSVASAGLRPIAGHAIDDDTAWLIEQMGGSVNGHRARRVRTQDLERSVLVLAATRDLRAQAALLLPRAVQYLFTIRQVEHILNEAYPDGPPRMQGENGKVRVTALVDALRDHRLLPPGDPADDDVVDPFGKSRNAHVLAASQILPSIDVLGRALGAQPLEPPPELAKAMLKAPKRRGRRRWR